MNSVVIFKDESQQFSKSILSLFDQETTQIGKSFFNCSGRKVLRASNGESFFMGSRTQHI